MPPRIATVSELLDSLDAAMYFFVSSGVFFLIAGVLFFALGLWLGGLLWSRYKKRFRESEDVIEAFKSEVALLKRRVAEQTTRPGAGPSPLQSIAFRTARQTTPSPTGMAGSPLPPAKAFTIWTGAPVSPARVAGVAMTRSMATARQPLFSPLDLFISPRSRAFSIWTEPEWQAPRVKAAPAPAALSFSLWTLPEFEPACGRALPLSRAHTVWTEPGWTPSRKPGPPARSARAYTLWTAADWTPSMILPWSRGFTLWTDEAWSAKPAKGAPLPPGEGWSLWTAPEFAPSCRGALLPSRAHSVWTEAEWVPPRIAMRPLPKGKGFSVWTEPPAKTPDRRPSFIARAVAAARNVLVAKPKASAPVPRDDKPGPEPVVAVKPPAGVAELPAVPSFPGTLPPSQAFTLWTRADTIRPARRVVRGPLTELIESRTGSAGSSVSGKPLEAVSEVPPVPLVPGEAARP